MSTKTRDLMCEISLVRLPETYFAEATFVLVGEDCVVLQSSALAIKFLSKEESRALLRGISLSNAMSMFILHASNLYEPCVYVYDLSTILL